jgi:long-chain acyl-CoA synthetase
VVDGKLDGARPYAELEEADAGTFDLEAAWRAVTADDIAVLIYTSGTTGRPRGVELTHDNIVSQWFMTSQSELLAASATRHVESPAGPAGTARRGRVRGALSSVCGSHG